MGISSPISLILVLLYGCSIALLDRVFFSMALPILWLLYVMRYSFFDIFKKLILLNALILIVVLTLLLQAQWDMAILIFIRSNAILLFVLLMFHDKNEFDIAFGMQQLRLPDQFVSMIFFTAKFIFLIKREFTLFKKTLQVRGFVQKTNFFTYKILAGFVGLLVIKAFKRANALEQTMHLRQFKGKIYTLTTKQTWHYNDIIVSILTLLSIILHQGALL